MSSMLMNITERGQISIPADVRRRWQVRRVLLVDDGESITLRPVPDDPLAAVRGKYASLGVTSDDVRAEERAAAIARDDRR